MLSPLFQPKYAKFSNGCVCYAAKSRRLNILDQVSLELEAVGIYNVFAGMLRYRVLENGKDWPSEQNCQSQTFLATESHCGWETAQIKFFR